MGQWNTFIFTLTFIFNLVGAIECVECSADGQIVAWGTTNGNLLMWELASPNNNNNRCGVDEIHCHLIERSNCVHGEAVSNLDNTVKSFFPVCALEFIETPEVIRSIFSDLTL